MTSVQKNKAQIPVEALQMGYVGGLSWTGYGVVWQIGDASRSPRELSLPGANPCLLGYSSARQTRGLSAGYGSYINWAFWLTK